MQAPEIENPTCRICLQEENLVRVCQCRDKVHIACLNRWRHVKASQSYALPLISNFRGVSSCEVCLKPYRIEDDTHISKNPKILRKYMCKITLDLILFFGSLTASYFFFGWVATPIWKPSEPSSYGGEDAVKIANGVIWTHMIITVVVLASMLVRGDGGCCCIYMGGDTDCDGEGAIIAAVVMAVIGITLAFMFMLLEIIQKRMLQMEAELYLTVDSRNSLDEISIS